MTYGPTVTLDEAAELMNIHAKTVVSDYINTGELPAAKLGRGYVMMTSDVLALIQRRIAQQTAERMRRGTLQCPSAPQPVVPRRRRRRVGTASTK
jgi:excisionase family DNA binding protein